MVLFRALPIILLFGWTASISLAVPTYRISRIGLQEGETNFISGVSKNGQVAGESYFSSTVNQFTWRYDGVTTTRIGLIGPEYTSNTGWEYSYSSGINERGDIIGGSVRHLTGVSQSGDSLWLNDGNSTIEIGLVNAPYTRQDGYRNGNVNQINNAGQVIGSSECYTNSEVDCLSAWLYSEGQTTPLGLTDDEHTDNYGSTHSFPRSLNEAGMVAGLSWRFVNGSNYSGDSAWLYDGSSTTRIGFYGSEHTRNDQFRSSAISGLNNAGHVIGTSRRYNGGGVQLGQSAWLYDGSTTQVIGLTDALHTKTDGTRYSAVSSLNEAGQAIGFSREYSPTGSDSGQTAWLFNGNSTIAIGLPGNSTEAKALNQAGHVIGESVSGGRKAWLYDGTNTVDIGLAGTEFTQFYGARESFVDLLNESGMVVGRSTRYNGGTQSQGAVAWLYNNGTHARLGLSGSEYTRSDGSEVTTVYDINEAGQVSGYTNRHINGQNKGQDAWFYDPLLDQTFLLQLFERSDGYASSRVAYMGEDGLILGTYETANFDTRAFYFKIDDGLHDLGSLIEDGLAANGWTSLLSAARSGMRSGPIYGNGVFDSSVSTYTPFFLTPISADFDDDGDVDGRDFLAWQRGFGKVDATLADGDANGDSMVDAEDLAIWQSQHAGNENLSASHAVPEPSSALLALWAIALAARVRVREIPWLKIKREGSLRFAEKNRPLTSADSTDLRGSDFRSS